MPSPSDLSRTLPVLWGAIGAGGALMAVVLAAVRPDAPPVAGAADAAFYGVALASAVATAAALALVRSLDTPPPDRPGHDATTVQTRGVAALAIAEAPALLAAVAAFVTGNTLVLAFVVPFLAFVALTWPTADRVARWTGADRR